MKTYLQPLMILLMSSAVCFTACEEEEESEEAPIENKQVYHTTVNGDVREYIVYVPSHYDAQHPYPVVFQLHGGSGNGEKFYNISGWNELAEEHSFLAVYPTSWVYDVKERGCGNGLVTHWNDYELKDEVCPGAQLRDEVAFIDQIIDELGAMYSIDDRRIYVSGFSNGGGMSSRLAIELSDRLAAVGMLAGSLPNDTTASYTPARILPIHLMVGTVDEKIGEVTSFPGRLPMDIPTVLADPHIGSLLQTWITTFDLNPNYAVTDSIGSVMTATYTGNSGDADYLLKFTLLENVGHFFPNPENRPGAADILWRFFESYSL